MQIILSMSQPTTPLQYQGVVLMVEQFTSKYTDMQVLELMTLNSGPGAPLPQVVEAMEVGGNKSLTHVMEGE